MRDEAERGLGLGRVDDMHTVKTSLPLTLR